MSGEEGNFENAENRMNDSIPHIPPPIPPKPRKFTRPRLAYYQEAGPSSAVGRPPMASPITPEDEQCLDGHEQMQCNKRKLSLNLQLASSSHTNEEVSVPECKSPKIETPGHKRIWSPVMCTICMDDLFSYVDDVCSIPEPGSYSTYSQNMPRPETLRPIVNTRCGHLFHTECINKWFIENREKEIKECPYCKREMMANDTTRIFPIFE